MLCKPSRKLILTWAASSGDGKSMRPSSLIGEVKKLFGELREEICFEEGYPIQTIWDGRQRLIGMLREARESQEKKPAFFRAVPLFLQ